MPPAFIPTDGVIVEPDRTLAATAAVTDPRVVVVGRDDAAGRRVPHGAWRPDAVTWHDHEFGRVALGVAGSDVRLVATSLTHPRGWTATSADRRLETVTVNHAFLGVVVPPGVDRVDLEFAPPGFAAGVAVGCIGLAACALLVAAADRRRARD